MGLRETITRFFQRFFPKKEYPLYKTCTICGERVYLPFRCEYCDNYYCDRHRLPFDHDCKNIEAWKNSRTTPKESWK
ncbi:AN1-type zinc finger domain-containing protein [Methanoregula sp.]|uniref:AN1-type zinc finger domain-containing protein n=1 Tax=Methanoregula sp. TaxID=2052170 RepID=UPI003C7384F5